RSLSLLLVFLLPLTAVMLDCSHLKKGDITYTNVFREPWWCEPWSTIWFIFLLTVGCTAIGAAVYHLVDHLREKDKSSEEMTREQSTAEGINQEPHAIENNEQAPETFEIKVEKVDAPSPRDECKLVPLPKSDFRPVNDFSRTSPFHIWSETRVIHMSFGRHSSHSDSEWESYPYSLSINEHTADSGFVTGSE
ncbi:hypothetical protein PRIPAC_83486, partial [Pristionchus pacificus]